MSWEFMRICLLTSLRTKYFSFFWPMFHADKNQNGKITIDNVLFFLQMLSRHFKVDPGLNVQRHVNSASAASLWGSGSRLGTLWRAARSDDQTLCLLSGWPLLPSEERRANFTRQQLQLKTATQPDKDFQLWLWCNGNMLNICFLDKTKHSFFSCSQYCIARSGNIPDPL